MTSVTGIPVRRPIIRFDESFPRHYMGGDAFFSHFINGLTLTFPEGERFFVRALHDNMGAIDDPALRAEVAAFCGQEGQHAYQHQRMFDALRQQGYRIENFLRLYRRYQAASNKYLSPVLRLACTAGVEHYTATFGAMALQGEFLRSCHPSVKQLLIWHAVEEIEHKCVAFDALQRIQPSYPLRMLGFCIGSGTMLTWGSAAMVMLVIQDIQAHRPLPRTASGSITRFMWTALGPVSRYLHPRFHPRDIEDRHLLVNALDGISFAGNAGDTRDGDAIKEHSA